MTTLKNDVLPSILVKLLALVAVAASIVLAFFAWNSLLAITLDLSVRFAMHATSADHMVQQSGIVVTVRTLTMMCGGAFWLAVAVGGISFHSHFLGKRRSWKVLAWTIGIELALIALDILI